MMVPPPMPMNPYAMMGMTAMSSLGAAVGSPAGPAFSETGAMTGPGDAYISGPSLSIASGDNANASASAGSPPKLPDWTIYAGAAFVALLLLVLAIRVGK